jgi:MFS family permease
MTVLIIAGLIANFLSISVYAIPGFELGKRSLGLAFGVILTFSNFGNTVGPVLAGWINTLTNGYQAGMIMSAVFILCAAFSAVMMNLKKRTTQHKAEASTADEQGVI